MKNLHTKDRLLLRKIVIFYMTHHMSPSNPQYKEIEAVLDKITDSIDKWFWPMLEVGIPLSVAIITGIAAMTNRLHNRISQLDHRVDGIQLRVAREYVRRDDMESMIDRVESHLIRLENKLDKLTFR